MSIETKRWMPAFAGMTLLFLSAPAHATLGPDDNLIIPGERVGMVTKDTTEAELIAKLGKKNVTRKLEPVEEFERCVTVINPHTAQELTIRRRDSIEYPDYIGTEIQRLKKCQSEPLFTSIDTVEIYIPSFRTKNHIQIGTTLKKLEAINKKPLMVGKDGLEDGMVDWNSGAIQDDGWGVRVGINGMGLYEILDHVDGDLDDSRDIASNKIPTIEKTNIAVTGIWVRF